MCFRLTHFPAHHYDRTSLTPAVRLFLKFTVDLFTVVEVDSKSRGVPFQGAVLRKRINSPLKRISQYYENAFRNITKTHRKSIEKRTDLKLEYNKIRC